MSSRVLRASSLIAAQSRKPYVLDVSSIVVSDLAYAHPGGDLLFESVSFKLPPSRHAGLVGANGVGKSTLLRIIAGALDPVVGSTSVGDRALYMAQDVGIGEGTVRELLLSAAPSRIRDAGLALLAAGQRPGGPVADVTQ